ncbi:MAG: type I-D CRISPR-associated protein Cas7/Csc2 [Candidatus Odinarchaeota archaeon]|nr:type I-D CRISPR-associated protein Cas7/Csc2 [Candidatus Odinarchaeota archaeon]
MFLDALKGKEEYFEEKIPILFSSKRIQVIALRETVDPCIFRTDVEGLDVTSTRSGFENEGIISRSIIFMRKLVASERRTGKQLLRSILGKIPCTKEGRNIAKVNECFLNQSLCGVCVDCTLFGFTKAEGIVRKSRVEYGTAYSIREYEKIYEVYNWNAIQEDTQSPGQSFGDIEVIKPGVVYPTVTTLHSVTEKEFIYYLWLLLNTKRYGAITTRTGHLKVDIVGIVFANSEPVSSLELTMAYYDILKNEGLLDVDVLTNETLSKYSDNIIKSLIERSSDSVEFMNLVQTKGLLDELREKLFSNKDKLKEFVTALETETEKMSSEIIKSQRQ